MRTTILFISLVVGLSSCLKVPKYATIEQVLSIRVGMTKDTISKILRTPPYDLKNITDSTVTLIYKYRTTDRRVFQLHMKQTNGIEAKGKWVDLFVMYGRNNRALEIKSCSDCESKQPTAPKINMAALLTTIATMALPTILVFVGLNR